MPHFGRHQYGRFQYGKYTLHTKGNGLQVSDAIRLRMLSSALRIRTDKVTMNGEPARLRMRAQNGEWVYAQEASIQGETFKVRIRTLGSSEWVESIRYHIKGDGT